MSLNGKSSLNGKTLFITGASRGIGLAIALRAAQDGANIIVAAKTAEAHPKLEGTIFTAADSIEKAGGRALPIQLDIREDAAVEKAMADAAAHFGGIDIVVNNASAINLAPMAALDMKRFDLMHQINARGTYLVSKCALPYLSQAENPHILMLSPPLDMKAKWFAGHTGYSMAKFGMSLVTLGLAGETKGRIGVNALWPRTTIATAAVRNILGGDALIRASRKPDILADAAHLIFCKPGADFTGNFLIDDTFLASEGITEFDHYRFDPSQPLAPDFFVPDDIPAPASASYRPLVK
jgi:citronellol/citronellal dehydrogenase